CCSCPALNAVATHSKATLFLSRAPSLLALLRMSRHPPARRMQHYLPRADIDVHGGTEHIVRKLSKSPIQPM
ncbi:hypothetical protein BGW80DRAFT_1320422, partial [Lactifluus volemus]